VRVREETNMTYSFYDLRNPTRNFAENEEFADDNYTGVEARALSLGGLWKTDAVKATETGCASSEYFDIPTV
jgi:hypothetical protein